MMSEAFNKAQVSWVRRQLEGINQYKTGAEGSIRRIDDLQVLLSDYPLEMIDKALYYESKFRPIDYMDWCRISANAWNECCPPRPLTIFLGNEADRDMYLADSNREPSYDWKTTFATCINDTFRIYSNGQFTVQDPILTYYREPRKVVFKDCINLDTKQQSTIDVLSEFPDNIIELIIDDAASLLMADMDALQKAQYLAQNAERSN